MTRRSARRVQVLPIEEELSLSFGRYAEKVILDRAIPDVRDGLKPVQRRIIYAMYESGNRPDKAYRKSAKTVGSVMGDYHPHGDSAIYDAMVRLAQPWKMRYPLIDGHGNFGSMDDDPAAAMRYTEARLSPIAMELLADIDKDTVPWRPNFDEQKQEPVVLPAGFLNLLVNGTSGVSAGFATDVPSHNLREVTNAALALLADPTLDLDALMTHVRGPDFPTGGIVMGAEGLADAYKTGKGKVVLRGRHTIERERDGKHNVVFTEIPYNVIKSDLVRQLDALRIDKAVHGLADVRDETDRAGLRIVVECARGADPEGILAFLFKKTDLQINYYFNMVAIERNTPRQLGLKPILTAFVAHRRAVVRRRSQHDLDQAEARLHEVDGLIVAIDMLDEVIATIRRSKDRADARANLVELGFTEPQSDAILDLRLARLTNLQLVLLVEERDQLVAQITKLRKILGDPAECDRVVAAELAAVRDRFGDDRRTTIEAEVERIEVALEVTVKAQDVVVGVTRQGWIKRVSLASFQSSGGDRKSSGVRPGDRMLHVLMTNTRDAVLVFSASGQCFPIRVHQIPEAKWGDVGTALVNVCGIDKDDGVVEVIPRATVPEDRYLMLTTAMGLAKATPINEFESSRSAGIVAVKLADGDRLSSVVETDLSGETVMVTEGGFGIRFMTSEVSVQGRSARGVRALKVAKGDALRSLELIDSAFEGYIAVFTRAGRAKLTPFEQFPKQRRGGKGVRMIISRMNNPHSCAGLVACTTSDSFEVVDTHGNEHIVPASRIPVTRRDGNAWTMVELKQGALVALVEHLPMAPEPGALSDGAASGEPSDGDG